jgi:hypothetical protein
MSVESERLTRIEEHLKFLKKDGTQQQDTLNDIKSALVGNPFNDNKGLTHDVAENKVRLNKLELEYSITKDNMNQLKWFCRAIASLIFGYIVWLIQSNK